MAGLIYTANFGSYDSPKAPGVREKGIDYVMFSDSAKPTEWDHEWLTLGDKTPQFMARKVKVLAPWERDYDWFLWLDHTMQIKAPLMPLIEKLLTSNHDFAAFKHNEWPCAYREIAACIERKKDDPINLLKARALLEEHKLPKNFGQPATGVLWRRHTPTVKTHAAAWWKAMQETTLRDQATFMLNLWQKKIYIEWIPGLHTKNKWIDYKRGHVG